MAASQNPTLSDAAMFRAKPINIEISILKALGIIAVVISHHYNPFPYYFNPNSFHMALFYFAAGYFYATKNEDNALGYLKKRLVWFFSVYYVYHMFHALLSSWLWANGIQFGKEGPIWPEAFYFPLIGFNSYGLGFSMWFVLQLFITQIAYVLVRKALRFTRATEWEYTALFAALAVLSIVLSNQGYASARPELVQMRTLFTLLFLHLGYLYRTQIEGWNIFTSRWLVVVFAVQIACISLYKDISYTVGFMKFGDHVFLPLVVACTGIYACLYLAKALASVVDEGHILCRIGNNTFHIAALHMVFGFVVIVLLRQYFGITEPIKSVFYGYDMERFWALYVGIGVLGPVYVIENLRKLRRYLLTVAA